LYKADLSLQAGMLQADLLIIQPRTTGRLLKLEILVVRLVRYGHLQQWMILLLFAYLLMNSQQIFHNGQQSVRRGLLTGRGNQPVVRAVMQEK
jgi:hypothetical protein